MRRAALGALIVALAGCPQPGATLRPGPAADDGLRADCALAERRCSRCHSIDRVVVARIGAPREWESTVDRMRRLPGSLIGRADATRITRCLVFRSFGPAGLETLEPMPPEPEGGP